MATHADWLSLVELSGLVVSEPVIDERFPGGPFTIPRGLHTWFRSQAASYDVARETGDDAGIRKWIDFLLEQVLELTAEHWLKAGDVPDSCRTWLDEYQQELRADRVVVHKDKPVLLVQIVPRDQALERQDRQLGKWKASPTTKLERLLRDTGHELGLLTNGESFRLMFAPSGMNSGAITWTSPGLVQEKATLDAFATLLGRKILVPAGKDELSLLDICKLSRERQGDVADQLGLQVRNGLERLIWAWDTADRAADGDLLAGMPEDEVYEMGLSVMMRLVFLLYAEERSLLPHGEVLYDQGYGLTYLWHRLQDQKRERQSTLDQTHDAWDRFLATGRLIHGGCRHPDLSLRAYGGNLFDPARYPVLEDERCRISNRTLHDVLYLLLFARQRRGGEPQRVGYWALDIEQIGYVYEGLLDHRCARAGEVPVVKLKGAGEEAVEVTALEDMEQDELVAHVAKATGRKTETIVPALDKPDERDIGLLKRVPADVAERVLPYAGIIQCDEVVAPGHRYLTTGVSRRASGAHYTPQSLTERVVRVTLEPQVFRCEDGKPGKYVEPREVKTPRELLDLKVCDMAMGSGAFLVQVVRYLADRLVAAWDREVAAAVESVVLAMPFAEPVDDPEGQPILRPEDREEMILWARRYVAERCVYGVDINPLAVEMAKLSLWLTTLAKDRPFTFVDHALKCGDSLVGVDAEQLRTWSLDRKGSSMPLLEDITGHAVDRAIAARKKLAEVAVVEAEDIDRKATLLAEAEEAMDLVRIAGDLLIAPSLVTDKPKQQAAMREQLQIAFANAETDEDWEELQAKARKALDGHATFHWPFEFPEVFMDGKRSGFDAIVGNPPFMGGRLLGRVFGKEYDVYLRQISEGRKGSADLVVYFLLRGMSLLGSCGFLGLVATNSIGDTGNRSVGLSHLLASGRTLYAANTDMAWPGQAAISVSLVHLASGIYNGCHRLNDTLVDRISSRLDCTPEEEPHKLHAMLRRNSQGFSIMGEGFVLRNDEEMLAVCSDGVSGDVVKGYFNGSDLNNLSILEPRRWIIDFGNMDESEARNYPNAFERAHALVRPYRETLSGQIHEHCYWKFWDRRPSLQAELKRDGELLACSIVTKYLCFQFVPAGNVCNHKIKILFFREYSELAVLQSTLHEVWARWRSGLLGSDTMNYSTSQALDTFAMPCGEADARTLAGTKYIDARNSVRKDRSIGLTKTYNLFHNPECKYDDIVRLRELHVKMDNAVRDAYGWSDLDLEHGWIRTVTTRDKKNRKTGKVATVEKVTWRYTISENARQEVLRRLLKLNHQRYAEEVAQGLHDKKKGKKKSMPKANRKAPKKIPASTNLSLFGGEKS